MRWVLLALLILLAATAAAAYQWDEIIVWGTTDLTDDIVWGTTEVVGDTIVWGVDGVPASSNCTFNDGTFGTDCTF